MTIIPFPRDRVGGRRLCLETRIYDFARPTPIPAPMIMPIAWLAWSVVFCALCVAVWGR